ncbi:MAG: septum site-determining protein MinC, partial [Cyanobacteria bacterium J06607_6]
DVLSAAVNKITPLVSVFDYSEESVSNLGVSKRMSMVNSTDEMSTEEEALPPEGHASEDRASEGHSSEDSTDVLDEGELAGDPDFQRRSGSPNLQVRFKSERGRLLLMLPPDPNKSRNPVDWEELRQQLSQRLAAGGRFFQPNMAVHLVARDRLLDGRQIQVLDEMLAEAELRIKRIYTKRRQTAVAAAAAGYSVEQQTQLALMGEDMGEGGKAMEEPLYLQTTLRSGAEVRHPGSVIIVGDVNPGSTVVAEGDIFVWGRLRGVAHAGSSGNESCRIMALQMQPTQLRIGERVARAPEKPPQQYRPEVAYVGGEGIRIALAAEFALMEHPTSDLNVP